MSGETAVHVKYGSQELDLPIIDTKGKGFPLMGRDWLSKIELNWHHIDEKGGRGVSGKSWQVHILYIGHSKYGQLTAVKTG